MSRRTLADPGDAVSTRQEIARVPARRLRSVGTKVTAEEYAAIATAAGEQRISEWVRRAVLAAATAEPAERVLLGELLALRAILLTLHFSVAAGEALTTDTMQRLIDRADQDKLRKAQERLAAPVTRRRS